MQPTSVTCSSVDLRREPTSEVVEAWSGLVLDRMLSQPVSGDLERPRLSASVHDQSIPLERYLASAADLR